MKEKVFSNLIRVRFKGKGHWTRVENIAGVGIPDINFFYEGTLPLGFYLKLYFTFLSPAIFRGRRNGKPEDEDEQE